MRADYIQLNDPETFEVIRDATTREQYLAGEEWKSKSTERPVVLSGAMWVGKTRLIDNLVLGDVKYLGIVE